MSKRIGSDRIRTIFNALGRDTLGLVDELYAEDVTFTDPFHRIEGRAALRRYYAGMYENVQEIRFDFSGETAGIDDLVLYWRMTFRHPRLGGGRPVMVEGCSRLVFAADGRVRMHRDYFDAGAMVYEQLPLLGRVVRMVRERVG
ncbi:MAG: nuclear transport factor 2 family protein [Pseudomonadota bacterium]